MLTWRLWPPPWSPLACNPTKRPQESLTTATTHVQELKDRGANQVELLVLQLENGELGSVAVTVPATASSPRTWS